MSVSKGGHTTGTGTAQDDGELEQKEAGVQQEDTVLAEGATPGENLSLNICFIWDSFISMLSRQALDSFVSRKESPLWCSVMNTAVPAACIWTVIMKIFSVGVLI